jgi:hypothetical protein
LRSRAREVGGLDRHCVDVIGGQGRMIEQACTQMRKVPVRIAGRRDPLVHLNDMHVLPRELFVRQCAQHQPRGTAAADRHDEAPARSDGRARVAGDNRRPFAGDQTVIRVDLDFHAITSSWCAPTGTGLARH